LKELWFVKMQKKRYAIIIMAYYSLRRYWRGNKMNWTSQSVKIGLPDTNELQIKLVSSLEGELRVVYVEITRKNDYRTTFCKAIERLVNVALKHNVDVDQIIDQLIDIEDGEPWHYEGVLYLSIPDAIGQTIKKYCKGNLNVSVNQD